MSEVIRILLKVGTIMSHIFPDKFRLIDDIAVVTGGAGLIGSQLCFALAEAGAKVYIAETDKAAGKELERRITECGLLAEYIYLDITSESAVDEAICNIISKDKNIDIWINNAYPRTNDWGNRFEDVEINSWRENIDMHLNGYFLCCKKVFDVMKVQKRGSIINFASIYGVVGPNFSIYEGTDMTMPVAYSAIKGGIINLTRYLSTYFGKYNIRVNAVCPGGIFDNQNSEFVKRYSENTPLCRMALPEEIAGSVLFLASQAASYITGHILMVDGGWTAQ